MPDAPLSLRERVARHLVANPRLAGVPAAVIEDVVRLTFGELARMELPQRLAVDDLVESLWDECARCRELVPAQRPIVVGDAHLCAGCRAARNAMGGDVGQA